MPLIGEIEKSIILTSPVRMAIMLLLQQHQRIIISELQKLMKETPGNLDYHIKQLEKENLVIKKPGLLNKRVYKVLEITESGLVTVNNDINKLKLFLNNFKDEKR